MHEYDPRRDGEASYSLAIALLRFELYFMPEPNSGCWLWTGTTDGRYGKFWFQDGQIKAHRFSYWAFKGDVPDDLDVCHKCDTPACVNPNHLFLGTRTDNLLDAGRKGRLWWQNHKSSIYLHAGKAKGDIHGMAKLRSSDIPQIREMSSRGQTNKAIAECLGVSETTIARVVSGRTWRHV